MNRRELDSLYITRPWFSDSKDGLGFQDGEKWTVSNCVIDMTACLPGSIDEAVGITYGSSVTFHNCVIRGAGKLLLCGSGDQDHPDPEVREKAVREKNATVHLSHCVLENFGRRGPEVQGGMHLSMYRCLIRNWGDSKNWDARAFGAWAHHGGFIRADQCVFDQPRFGNGHFWQDLFAHVGQAVNDSGWPALATLEAWMPGMCRGLTATAGGYCDASHATPAHHARYPLMERKCVRCGELFAVIRHYSGYFCPTCRKLLKDVSTESQSVHEASVLTSIERPVMPTLSRQKTCVACKRKFRSFDKANRLCCACRGKVKQAVRNNPNGKLAGYAKYLIDMVLPEPANEPEPTTTEVTEAPARPAPPAMPKAKDMPDKVEERTIPRNDWGLIADFLKTWKCEEA